MEFLLDVHTHTIASGHAYNTMQEMTAAAKEKGLKLYGISEHGIAMPGTCSELYFINYPILPRNYEGMELLFGAEANILDFHGTLDITEKVAARMDYMVASMHPPCITPGSKKENTNAYLRAMEQPKVSIIGHPDDGRYPVDYERLVDGAKACGCLLEINNSSLSPNSYRAHAKENLAEMLSFCEKKGVMVIANSDAHIKHDIGSHCYSSALLEELHFPEELIVNRDTALFRSFLK